MEKPQFWILTCIGVLLTPIFFLASSYSGQGSGSHAGGGFQMLAFFPIPFLFAIAFDARGIGILLAALQFPAFGFILSYIRKYKQSIVYSLISLVIWIHVVVSLLVLALVLLAATANG